MKKILFLCSNMGVGGVQKSLISLLQHFDYQKYSVDLLLLNPSGIFMNLIPEQVNLLPPVIDPDYFFSGKDAVLAMFRKRKYRLAFARLISCLLWIFSKGAGASYMVKVVPGIDKKYDAVIDYGGQQLLYYMTDKLHGRKFISYFHSDYKKWRYYEKTDRKYYSRVNAIVTVSEECVASMKDIFPEYADKIYCIENINSEKTVNLFPLNSNNFKDNFDGIRLVTVGRVCKDKGFDYALQALHLLNQNGCSVRWYMVGPVTEERFYQECIEKYGFCENMIMLGATNNPYDYMRNADIIVHPSRFEGKAVAVEEAKILRKPVVATNFSTVKNQIIHEETGLIAEMNAQSVYENILRLINDTSLRNHIISQQKVLCTGNETEVNKLYQLIEN